MNFDQVFINWVVTQLQAHHWLVYVIVGCGALTEAMAIIKKFWPNFKYMGILQMILEVLTMFLPKSKVVDSVNNVNTNQQQVITQTQDDNKSIKV